MKYHPAACIFPMLSDELLDELADDIEDNGLQEPIETFEGLILDGRNRYEACLLVEVVPEFVEWEGEDPVLYVLSKNLHRRHLTIPQRSIAAAKAKEMYDRDAKNRMKSGAKGMVNFPYPEKGTARDKAGEAFGVSGRSVDTATKIIDNGSSALLKAVDEGKLSLNAASKLVDLPKSEQTKVAKAENPKKAAAEVAKAAQPKKQKQGEEVASPMLLVDQMIKGHISPLVRGIDSIAKINGGKGPCHQKADDALDEILEALEDMRKGKK